DRVAADALDRLGEVDLPPVDADLELLPDLVGDVGRRHGPEEGSLWAGVHVEAKLGLAQLLGDLLRVLEALRLVARALCLSLLELGHAGRRRLLGEPPRPEVVPHIAARNRHDIPAQADLLHVFQEDDVHGLPGDVGEKCHLTRTLDRDRDLLLVAPARSRDAPGTDLALLGYVATQLVVVLVVDLFDLLLAEVTALPPERT